MCWVTFCGLVGYDVTSVALRQPAKLSNGNAQDFQTIDTNTSNNNSNITNCLTTIITTIVLTTRIILMKSITRISQCKNNQTGTTNHNIKLLRVQAQNERIITQIQATVTKLLFVHTQQRTKQVSAGACVAWMCLAMRV